MPESARHVEYRAEELEEVADPRIPELKQKLKRLYEAQSGILVDAGNRVLTKTEKKAIIGWMKKRGSEEEWPLDDNITLENYQARLAPYGVADLIDTRHITGKNDIYNLVTRQYNTFAEELRGLTEQPKKFHVIGSERAEAPPPVTEAPPSTAERGAEEEGEEPPPVVEEHEFEYPPNVAMSWKVWEMIFAVLHAMQKHPDQFEEFKNLSPEELKVKLRDEGPRLVKEYMQLATRGRMEWNASGKEELWKAHEDKLANVDVKVSLLVLEKAGFKVDLSQTGNLQMVPPSSEGTAKPFVLQFDTMDQEKRDRLEVAQDADRAASKQIHGMHIETSVNEGTDLKEGEYRITVDHHTSDPSERLTSAAQLLYDYFLAAGVIERDETLERLLKFTNAHDNGEFPTDKEFYLRSARTVWGIASDTAVPASLLYELFKRGRGPEDALTDNDLTLPLQTKKKMRTGGRVEEINVQALGDFVRWKEYRVAEDAKQFDLWKRHGYIVDTDYGPTFVCLDIPGRQMPKQIVAKSYGGVPNILTWTPEKHSFSIALGKGKQFKPGTEFPQGKIIRGHMAIYKKQERTPDDLTASLREILSVLSRGTKRTLEKDLRAFVEQDTNQFATWPTLFYIFTTNPAKREAVAAELARRPNAEQYVGQLIKGSFFGKREKDGYREMLEAMRRYLRTHPR